MKTTEELRKMDLITLKQELETLKQELFKSRFEVRTGNKNIHLISNLKKQVARIKTILTERNLVESNTQTNEG